MHFVVSWYAWFRLLVSWFLGCFVQQTDINDNDDDDDDTNNTNDIGMNKQEINNKNTKKLKQT